MSQSMNFKELQRLADEQVESYPLGPTIALTYLSVLEDCELHCSKEGAEVKRLGGLHVIGTSLHESRRIDNQVGFPPEISPFMSKIILVQNLEVRFYTQQIDMLVYVHCFTPLCKLHFKLSGIYHDKEATVFWFFSEHFCCVMVTIIV